MNGRVSCRYFVVLGLMLAIAPWATAQPWDLATDWSDAANPFGQFTVGIEDIFSSFEAFGLNTTGSNDNYFGVGSPAWVLTGSDPSANTIPGLARVNQNGPFGPIDVLDGSIIGHTPALLDARGHMIRWTAPNTETVNVLANLWDAVDQSALEDPPGTPAPEIARMQRFELRHNGVIVKSGGLLLQEQGFNSGNKQPVAIQSLDVTAGDTVDLFVALANSNTPTGDFVAHDLTISQGASAGTTPDYARSMASDFFADFLGGPGALPVNNPNGDWSYLATGDADPASPTTVPTDGGNPNTFGIGSGWAEDPGGVPSYARSGAFNLNGIGQEGIGMAGHGPTRIVWTAPDDINLGGVALEGYIRQQNFEPARQMQLRIYKNDIEGNGTPLVTVDADFNTQLNLVPFSGTQVSISPGDTLTTFVDGLGPMGDGVATFAQWDVIITEVEIVGLPGDFNNDGTVNAADYTLWRDHLGDADESALNGNGDGINGIDVADYNLWRANFGSTNGAGSGATIPEPAGWTLAALALVACGCGRRYRAA